MWVLWRKGKGDGNGMKEAEEEGVVGRLCMTLVLLGEGAGDEIHFGLFGCEE